MDDSSNSRARQGQHLCTCCTGTLDGMLTGLHGLAISLLRLGLVSCDETQGVSVSPAPTNIVVAPAPRNIASNVATPHPTWKFSPAYFSVAVHSPSHLSAPRCSRHSLRTNPGTNKNRDTSIGGIANAACIVLTILYDGPSP